MESSAEGVWLLALVAGLGIFIISLVAIVGAQQATSGQQVQDPQEVACPAR